MILPHPIAAYDPYKKDGSKIEILSTSEFTARLVSGPGLPAVADWSKHHAQVLEAPEYVFEGVRVDALFNAGANISDKWLCYTGRVAYYHDFDDDGQVVQVELPNGGLEECYCVFINDKRRVYFAEFRDCMADGRPRDSDDCFGRTLVEPTQ